jgi:hypothetical protein
VHYAILRRFFVYLEIAANWKQLPIALTVSIDTTWKQLKAFRLVALPGNGFMHDEDWKSVLRTGFETGAAGFLIHKSVNQRSIFYSSQHRI